MKQGAADDDNFNILDAIKTELDGIIPNLKFSEMSFEFLTNFVVEKGFVLSPTELRQFFCIRIKNCFKSLEDDIKVTYELAEKQALKKQEMFPEENFNLRDEINALLVDVIPRVKFSIIDNTFLTDFGVANGIISEEQADHIFDTRGNEKFVVPIYTLL
uniref:Uncharacterized protein n=1 Tax=Panagrolaimus superbus TaxID=310955 RepID=A0A914YV02_9BILA